MFGFTAEETGGASLRELIVPETRAHESELIQETVDRDGAASIETVRRGKNGELVDVALLAGPLEVGGRRAGYIYSYRDIGARKEFEAKLQHDALHDTLTGLPNRALFLDRLGTALRRRARRRDQNCAVLFLDVDRFKEINDSFGHAAGDEFLKEASRRLLGALRPQDTAARFGGDEFAVLVENLLSPSDMGVVATRILTAMDRPFELLGNPIHVAVSIGAAMAGDSHTAPELLIRDADFAMYRAKQDGGARFEIFDKQMVERVTYLEDRDRELRQMLDKRQFEIWYQPIFRLDDGKLAGGKLAGFESLLRWRRSDGVVEVFDDLPSVADESGLSISLGREMLETVCKRSREWLSARSGPPWTLAVNVTHRQFYHPDFLAQTKRAIAASGIDPSRLLLEVRESVLNENPDAAAAIFQHLADCNVRLAIDNFGSALAALNQLVRMPIDVLKLDPKLTLAAGATGRQVAVLESLIHLGRKLGVQVVALGIETPEQLDALRRMGCELGQGRFLSPALDPVAAQALAAQGCLPADSRS
jgi:diguanylate cyclase (GGDEF)-like protein/PAS domain S-box-containing protein